MFAVSRHKNAGLTCLGHLDIIADVFVVNFAVNFTNVKKTQGSRGASEWKGFYP
jgi:hypothetical protein